MESNVKPKNEILKFQGEIMRILKHIFIGVCVCVSYIQIMCVYI